MKKIMYLLSIGLMVAMLGCGTPATVSVKESPPVTPPAASPATPPPTTAPSPTPVEKNWVEIGSYSGTGMKDTEDFTIVDGSQYRLNWETYAADGSLSIIIANDKGGAESIPVDVKGISKDTTSLHVPSGNYHLSIITESGTKWKASIEKK